MRLCLRLVAILCFVGATWLQAFQGDKWGLVRFDSSDQRLVDGFNWAKREALSYVRTGDPVGDWYEAALPGRDAFCMRDVAHQAGGAQILGLAAFNRNMLHKFAASISDSRDWAGFWEIDKNNKPAPVDYKDDRDFWYNLPGNFVVVDACYNAYRWTGDRSYVDDPVFLNFYRRVLGDYIRRWDKDGDGIPESDPAYGQRGLGSFDENQRLHIKIGCDLVASEYAAYVAYSQVEQIRGNPDEAHRLMDKAEHLRDKFNREWWNPTWKIFNSAILSDGRMYFEQSSSFFPLWFGIVSPGEKTERQLDLILHLPPPGVFFAQVNERDTKQSSRDLAPRLPEPGVEEMSYIPEIAYRYGKDERGYTILLALVHPNLKRREYPEVSFSVIRTVTELMGIEPSSSQRTVKTCSHLTQQTAWASLDPVPVFENQVGVKHIGREETTFLNHKGGPIFWQACFPGRHTSLLVDGKDQSAKIDLDAAGEAESCATTKVSAGEARTATVPDDSGSPSTSLR